METKLSANNLFHFTPERKYLESIILNGFYPRYCLETMPFNSKTKGAFPMVCFCDIPFYLQKGHIERYGKYGIGLKMEWGVKNGLSPLIYCDRNSMSSRLITKLIMLSADLDIEEKGNHPEIRKILQTSSYISVFCKPYSGFENDKPKKFYDEREWRYVPDFPEGQTGFYLTEAQFNNPEIITHNNEAIKKIDGAILGFEISDIDYLILPNESEIDLFFNTLFNSSSDKSEDELRQLRKKNIVFSENLTKK